MKIKAGNHGKRKFYDGALQGVTYLSSGISVIVLVALFVFIFTRGWSSINMDLIMNNYWSENYTVETISQSDGQTFERPADLSEEAYFSEKWGIAFVDHVDAHKDEMILVEYIDENSPLYALSNVSVRNNPQDFTLQVGMQVSRLQYHDAQGNVGLGGGIMGQTAEQLAQTLDDNAATVDSMYIQTTGGGIRGSIISTVYLLLVSMVIALPIGIASAVYLNEYAKKEQIQYAAAQRYRNTDRCAEHRFWSDGRNGAVPGDPGVRCHDHQYLAGWSDDGHHLAADHHPLH